MASVGRRGTTGLGLVREGYRRQCVGFHHWPEANLTCSPDGRYLNEIVVILSNYSRTGQDRPSKEGKLQQMGSSMAVNWY